MLLGSSASGMGREPARGPTTACSFRTLPTLAAVIEDGAPWHAVDPQARERGCVHGQLYKAEDMAVTVCLVCGVEVEPLSARVLDLDAVRRRRSGQRRP